MERAQFRLQQLAAHLTPDDGSISFMACMGDLRRDSRVHYARAALNDARFMRPVQITEKRGNDEDRHSLPTSSGGSQDKVQGVDYYKVTPPLFSKPALQDMVQSVSEPLFSRISSLSPQEMEKGKDAAALAWAAAEEQPSHPYSETSNKGFEWFPRMDVVESGIAYVVTVELPGVSVEGICVEVDDDSLTVTGSRAADWWKNGGDVNGNGNGYRNGSDGGAVYHRRELAQGPYRAVWRLPKNAEIKAITAEFIDGFLRVLVPKARVIRYI